MIMLVFDCAALALRRTRSRKSTHRILTDESE
jgi:hypothetical protein